MTYTYSQLIKSLNDGQGHALQELINNGLDPNAFITIPSHLSKSNRVHLLSLAIKAGGTCKPALNVLLKNGSTPNFKGSTAWHNMAEKNLLGTLKFVSNFYPYQDTLNSNGLTPLQSFSLYGSRNDVQKKFEVFLWLLKNGANPNVKDEEGNGIFTNLFNLKTSFIKNKSAWIKTALNFGLDPNFLGKNSQSLLHEFGTLDKVVRVLLQGGADPFLNDPTGIIALKNACNRDDLTAAKMLWEKGVSMDSDPSIWSSFGTFGGKMFLKWKVEWEQKNLNKILSSPDITSTLKKIRL